MYEYDLQYLQTLQYGTGMYEYDLQYEYRQYRLPYCSRHTVLVLVAAG